jgi:dethiobiotin synthetase
VTAIFITATGPDVGKTLVVAALIRHLRAMGHAVDAIKPIVSGYELAQAAASDPGTLIAALGLPFSPESIERTSPWRRISQRGLRGATSTWMRSSPIAKPQSTGAAIFS